jgi:glucose-induced degradation protein 4
MPSSTENVIQPLRAKSKLARYTKHDSDCHNNDSGNRSAQYRLPRQDISISYPDFLGTPMRRRCTSSFLRPGSKFVGAQQSRQSTYEVNVELKDVDMQTAFICGYLRIEGLTEDHPTLITYFEGEMISEHYSFITQREDWGSNEKTDMSHWNRFGPWRTMLPEVQDPTYVHRNYDQQDYIYMRWKECFLVPDHRIQNIHNASYDGFYYICFDQLNGSITGLYYHEKSDPYQQLELTHVPDAGVSAQFEFR